MPIDLSKFAAIAFGFCLVLLTTSASPAQDVAVQDSIVKASDTSGSGFETGPRIESEVQPLEISDLPELFPQNNVEKITSSSNFVPVEENDSGDWLSQVEVGYDNGFVIASRESVDLKTAEDPFSMRINGWGQLRFSMLESNGGNRDQKQFQLQRGRLVFSGNAFTTDFSYFFQLDGRSSSGDDIRLLDYFLWYDLGHHVFGLERGTVGFKTGKYKMPFNLSRYLTAKEFEMADRSVASTYFDVNRSLAWGLAGRTNRFRIPINWEAAIFNGLVTGGAETGSSGDLDNNFAYSARIYFYPTGQWGEGELADFDHHCDLATRMGFGFANTTNNEIGLTEFNSLRVVDSGGLLSALLPNSVNEYGVSLYAVDASLKYRGWSSTMEYYFRVIDNIQGAPIPDLFDHGFWFQLAKFVVPGKVQLTTRWSRVVGDSGTLGLAPMNQSADEIAGGMVLYFRGQNAKAALDATYLNGAPISSSALDISPGDSGWLIRSQIQFAF